MISKKQKKPDQLQILLCQKHDRKERAKNFKAIYFCAAQHCPLAFQLSCLRCRQDTHRDHSIKFMSMEQFKSLVNTFWVHLQKRREKNNFQIRQISFKLEKSQQCRKVVLVCQNQMQFFLGRISKENDSILAAKQALVNSINQIENSLVSGKESQTRQQLKQIFQVVQFNHRRNSIEFKNVENLLNEQGRKKISEENQLLVDQTKNQIIKILDILLSKEETPPKKNQQNAKEQFEELLLDYKANIERNIQHIYRVVEQVEQMQLPVKAVALKETIFMGNQKQLQRHERMLQSQVQQLNKKIIQLMSNQTQLKKKLQDLVNQNQNLKQPLKSTNKTKVKDKDEREIKFKREIQVLSNRVQSQLIQLRVSVTQLDIMRRSSLEKDEKLQNLIKELKLIDNDLSNKTMQNDFLKVQKQKLEQKVSVLTCNIREEQEQRKCTAEELEGLKQQIRLRQSELETTKNNQKLLIYELEKINLQMVNVKANHFDNVQDFKRQINQLRSSTSQSEAELKLLMKQNQQTSEENKSLRKQYDLNVSELRESGQLIRRLKAQIQEYKLQSQLLKRKNKTLEITLEQTIGLNKRQLQESLQQLSNSHAQTLNAQNQLMTQKINNLVSILAQHQKQKLKTQEQLERRQQCIERLSSEQRQTMREYRENQGQLERLSSAFRNKQLIGQRLAIEISQLRDQIQKISKQYQLLQLKDKQELIQKSSRIEQLSLRQFQNKTELLILRTSGEQLRGDLEAKQLLISKLKEEMKQLEGRLGQRQESCLRLRAESQIIEKSYSEEKDKLTQEVHQLKSQMQKISTEYILVKKKLQQSNDDSLRISLEFEKRDQQNRLTLISFQKVVQQNQRMKQFQDQILEIRQALEIENGNLKQRSEQISGRREADVFRLELQVQKAKDQLREREEQVQKLKEVELQNSKSKIQIHRLCEQKRKALDQFQTLNQSYALSSSKLQSLQAALALSQRQLADSGHSRKELEECLFEMDLSLQKANQKIHNLQTSFNRVLFKEIKGWQSMQSLLELITQSGDQSGILDFLQSVRNQLNSCYRTIAQEQTKYADLLYVHSNLTAGIAHYNQRLQALLRSNSQLAAQHALLSQNYEKSVLEKKELCEKQRSLQARVLELARQAQQEQIAKEEEIERNKKWSFRAKQLQAMNQTLMRELQEERLSLSRLTAQSRQRQDKFVLQLGQKEVLQRQLQSVSQLNIDLSNKLKQVLKTKTRSHEKAKELIAQAQRLRSFLQEAKKQISAVSYGAQTHIRSTCLQLAKQIALCFHCQSLNSAQQLQLKIEKLCLKQNQYFQKQVRLNQHQGRARSLKLKEFDELKQLQKVQNQILKLDLLQITKQTQAMTLTDFFNNLKNQFRRLDQALVQRDAIISSLKHSLSLTTHHSSFFHQVSFLLKHQLPSSPASDSNLNAAELFKIVKKKVQDQKVQNEKEERVRSCMQGIRTKVSKLRLENSLLRSQVKGLTLDQAVVKAQIQKLYGRIQLFREQKLQLLLKVNTLNDLLIKTRESSREDVLRLTGEVDQHVLKESRLRESLRSRQAQFMEELKKLERLRESQIKTLIKGFEEEREEFKQVMLLKNKSLEMLKQSNQKDKLQSKKVHKEFQLKLSECKEANKQNIKLKADLEKLKAELIEKNYKIKGLQEHITFRSQRASFESSSKKNIDQFKRLQKQNLTLKEQIDDFKREKTALSARLQRDHDQVEFLKSKNTQLFKVLESFEAAFDKQVDKRKHLEESLTNANSIKARQSNQLQSKSTMIQQLQSQVKDLLNKRIDQKILKEKDIIISRMNTQMHSLRSKYQQLRRKEGQNQKKRQVAEEVKLMKQLCDNYQKKAQFLERKNNQLQNESSNKFKGLYNQVDMLMRSNKQKDLMIQKMRSEIFNLTEKCKKYLSTLKQLSKDRRDKDQRLDIKAPHRHASNKQMQLMRQQIQSLMQRKEQLNEGSSEKLKERRKGFYQSDQFRRR